MATGPGQVTDAQTLVATRMAVSATLAAALIAAARRPHSVDEAVKLTQDIHWSLWPNPSNGGYQVWKKDFKGREEHK
jgi:hypothetical protein